MSTIRLGVFVAALLFILSATVHAQNPAAPAKALALSAEAKWEAALSRKVSIDALDVPLQDVMTDLAAQAEVPIHLTRKIEDAGVQRDQPVTMTLQDVSLRACLRNLLRDLNLTFLVKDDLLKITTVEDAESSENHLTRVYPVKDLLAIRPETNQAEARQELDALSGLIRYSLRSGWRGSSSIAGHENSASLAVTSQTEIHDQVVGLLAALRQVRTLQAAGSKAGPLPVSLSIDHKADVDYQRRIETALDKLVSYDFVDVPLKDVCAQLAKDAGFRIRLRRKIEDAGVHPDQPVTMKLDKVPLRTFLRLLLGDRNLTFTTQDEALQITTVEDACTPESMVVRVYPVRDLVEYAAKTAGAPPEIDCGPLSELITSTVEPDSWLVDQRGLPTDEKITGGTIIIAQREDIHEKIAALLTQLRKAKSAQGLDRAPEAANKPVPPPVIPPPITRPSR